MRNKNNQKRYYIIVGHWVKYDDDEISMVTEEEVLKLSGGGKYHLLVAVL